MRSRRILATVLAAGVAVALSGCFTNPLESLGERVVEGGLEQLIERETGADVDLGLGSGGASIPDRWPSDIAVAEGQIVLSATTGDVLTLTVAAEDVASAVAAFEQTKQRGLEVESETALSEGTFFANLTHPDYRLSLGWIGDDDSVLVTYNVEFISE